MSSRLERSLSDIVLDPSLYPVTDELAAMERLVPEAPSAMERYALFWNGRPALLPIRARSVAHAAELTRFIGLAYNSMDEIEPNLDSCNALSILLNAANLAMMLITPRGTDDAWARAAFAATLRRQARRLRGARFQHQVDRILRRDDAGFPDAVADRYAPGDKIAHAIARAAASSDAGPLPHVATEGEAAVFTLEHAPSLQRWFDRGVDLADLLSGVRELFAQVMTWTRAWRSTAKERRLAVDAIAGARLLAFARLCRIGLWPARNADEVMVKREALRLLVAYRSEPDAMRALAELAFDRGELLAQQSERFCTMPPT
ncbi:conserved hypothetical protein [Hyphomicrobiales bacterium]|nr:conserved hypothetical protein [Hyphomicrobiales bacterium]CAH1701479.1 conserved hypothetical protein [Hyphomicrobiales bacterium]CAI0345436.1 conserved hypothetical protein [Hyphomicrobiales bacterium]